MKYTIIDVPDLNDSNGSRWKTSTILFENNMLSRCCEIRNSLIDGTRKFKGFQSFTTIEHGKARNIDALPIKERATQKCLCNNLLEKVLSRSFVYDNGASLKNKGMDFMLRRLKKHLADHYRKYGTSGAVYQLDFKNYFGSIPHDEIKSRMAAMIEKNGSGVTCSRFIFVKTQFHLYV